MKKILFFGVLVLGLIGVFSFIIPKAPKKMQQNVQEPASQKSIYDFKVASIDGGMIDFSKYKGKYLLIVNTASKCGFTPQYAGLEKLSKQYADKLVIVGFPSNNFLNQEFSDNKDIETFCQQRYGVTFPLTTRVDVKGKDITPVFEYLTHKDENGVLDATITWNFNKFLIDPQGKLLAHFVSKVTPESDEIVKYLR